MHLKFIELIGFKSFADKTRIELDSGFTAIVGPNGSGKSNITEAIKWVLGEQSAKSLRGHKMDDVIFAGAENRHRGPYAEVTLVFDNQDRLLAIDADDVSVSRRFTRSGESEYMINRRACRLKDITELMMDTGVGRDSFSIISQGKVEAIFTQKAEDRRGIFEEAAGVMKYKNRKKEAERKLNRAEENLQRIYDILSEVEARLTPLESQKEAALKYQNKKTELSEIEIALSAVQIETISEQWEIAKKDLASYTAEIAQKKGQLTEAQQVLVDCRQQEQTVEAAINHMQETYVTVVQQAEQIQGKIHMQAQKAAFNQRDKESQQAALAELSAQIAAGKAEVARLKAQMADMDTAYAEEKALFETVKADLAALDSNDQALLEETRNQYIESLQKQTHLRNQLAQADKDLAQQQRLKQQQAQQTATLQVQLAEAETQLAQTAAALADQQQAVAQLLQHHQDQGRELQTLTAARHQAEQQLSALAQTTMSLQARKQSLEDLERENAGFNQGAKAALGMQGQMAGIHGAVAQLLRVPAQYTTAVEIALGGGMQNIVTESGEAASQAIARLKRERAGRATFLPLDVIQGRHLEAPILTAAQKSPGYIGVLADLVSFDAKYQAVMTNLMGQVLVVDSLTNGREMARAIKNRFRIVTLDGDIINAGGSMTGGAYKRQGSGLLSRKADIEQLTAKIDQAARQQETMAATVAQNAQQAAALVQTLNETKEAGDEARFNERTLEQEHDRLVKHRQQLQADLAAQSYEQQLSSEDETALKVEYAANQALLADVSDQVNQLKQTLDNLNLSAAAKDQKREHVQTQYQETATAFAVLKERRNQLEASCRAEQQALQDKQDNYATLTAALADLALTADDEQGSSAELEAQYTALISQQQALDGELKQNRRDRQALHEQREATEASVALLNEQLQSLMAKQAKLEATAARYEVAIDNHLEQLSEEYGLTYERARAESQLTLSIEEASMRVRQLKREIDAIGPVNLGAIDEYAEVHERFVFMEKQRDDVIAAKDNLYQTIAEMDEEVATRFVTTFTAIRDAFEAIFPKLFGGGKASLQLTDEDDLLATGIDIIAQPPGKNLQHLSLLSGGEKALTAIALLFAILQVKTVPFSILDEVEAALDEANVGRFGRFLREFMTKTQFIVITHRKGTMEEANVLYGVTMQQSGVSKLASVKLADFDEAAP